MIEETVYALVGIYLCLQVVNIISAIRAAEDWAKVHNHKHYIKA